MERVNVEKFKICNLKMQGVKRSKGVIIVSKRKWHYKEPLNIIKKLFHKISYIMYYVQTMV